MSRSRQYSDINIKNTYYHAKCLIKFLIGATIYSILVKIKEILITLSNDGRIRIKSKLDEFERLGQESRQLSKFSHRHLVLSSPQTVIFSYGIIQWIRLQKSSRTVEN
jgi:hypothetical protein